jgi:amidohydrolase
MTRESWDGQVKFIFQPGEEKLPGGASLMIAEGVLENPKVSGIIGQHVFPELSVGKVGFRAGTYMASADEIYITVLGKGGHAAMPQQNIDPIVVAAEMIGSLQKIVSRNAPPATPTVLSFGKIIGDGATNVIPDKVFLEGTLRTFDEKWRFDAHDKIRRICQGIAEAHGARCETDIRVGYPFLNNDEKLTALARKAAVDYLGEAQVIELPLRMTAEDFAFYAQESAGCFYRLGTASADGSNSYGVHNARFDIDEQALEVGSGLMAFLAIQSLKSI